MGEADIMLVGDIGGTHARFATVDVGAPPPWHLGNRQDFAMEIPTFEQALRRYLQLSGLAAVPPAASIAVAGPVTGGQARLTNRDWAISEEALRRLGCGRALLINDFIALAFAVDTLQPADLRELGPTLRAAPGGSITIVGAGTGFGASCLARYGNRLVPMATEGGHVGFAPETARESEVLEKLRMQFGRVSIERLLSGPGLENLFMALQRGASDPTRLPAAEIVARATVQHDGECTAALDMFCAIYGSVAGDFALAHGARGGVYIAGGIAQMIQDFLARSAFRARFESKGRLTDYVRSIPTTLILSGDAALFGSARAGLYLR